MTLYKQVNNTRIKLTDEEEASTRAEWAKEDSKIKATQYSRDRQMAYPSLQDQFDQIYHEGIDAWKVTIKAVKDAHPKP